jgi:hypothetical protein
MYVEERMRERSILHGAPGRTREEFETVVTVRCM